MAELSLEIKKEKGREFGTRGVELTDDIWEELGYVHQIMVNIHEKFLGDVTHVGSFGEGSDTRYYVLRETADAVAQILKL